MTETWLPIPGFEGLYEVSDQGRVRSLDHEIQRRSRWGAITVHRWSGRILAQHRQKDVPVWKQYWTIKLANRDGSRHNHRVHQLVAAAFLGPCPDGQQVRHGPAGMWDNSVTNLSYGTPKQNAADQLRDGTRYRGEEHYAAKLTAIQAAEIRRRAQDGENQHHLAAEYGVSQSIISLIKRRKAWRDI